jgi:hypothetical protein
MQLVDFSFRPEVTAEQRDSVLDQIRRWDPIIEAMPLKPGATHPSTRRLHHAYVTDNDVAATVERLSSLPEIESAAVPAKRHLVG